MRPVTLNYAGISDPAIRAALAEIERASHEMNPVDIAQNFSINGTLAVSGNFFQLLGGRARR